MFDCEGGQLTSNVVALANFLRARREELQPEDVGLVARGRRRVRGLRRDEVANLAAISITWYTWLEQGRPIHVTTDVLDSLARALMFDEVGRQHLRNLAGAPAVPPKLSSPLSSDALNDALMTLEDVSPSPAWVTCGPTELVAWNAAYAALFGDPALVAEELRTSLWLLFCRPRIRNLIQDWEGVARTAIATFVEDAAQYPPGEELSRLVADLRQASADFDRLWDEHKVQVRLRPPEPVVMRDPKVGRIVLRPVRMRPASDRNLIVNVCRAMGPESRERLAILLATDHEAERSIRTRPQSIAAVDS